MTHPVLPRLLAAALLAAPLAASAALTPASAEDFLRKYFEVVGKARSTKDLQLHWSQRFIAQTEQASAKIPPDARFMLQQRTMDTWKQISTGMRVMKVTCDAGRCTAVGNVAKGWTQTLVVAEENGRPVIDATQAEIK